MGQEKTRILYRMKMERRKPEAFLKGCQEEMGRRVKLVSVWRPPVPEGQLFPSIQ